MSLISSRTLSANSSPARLAAERTCFFFSRKKDTYEDRIARIVPGEASVLISSCFYFSTSTSLSAQAKSRRRVHRRKKKTRDIHRDRGVFGFHMCSWPEGGWLQGPVPPLPFPGHECNYEMLKLLLKATLNNASTLCSLRARTFRQLTSKKVCFIYSNLR